MRYLRNWDLDYKIEVTLLKDLHSIECYISYKPVKYEFNIGREVLNKNID